MSVAEDLIHKDQQNPLHFGVLAIDPLFEVAIAHEGKLPPRLYFGKINRDNLVRTPDDIGSRKKWMGTFEEWIEDEYDHGTINIYEKEDIFRLYEKWQKNPDPLQNEKVKKELTQYLTQIVWERR